MPSVSKKQQKFMGIVRSIQKGEQPASKFSKSAQKAAKKMKKSSVKKYAKTKHDDLPVKKESLSKSQIKKMRDEFDKTGELPPHLKKISKDDTKKFINGVEFKYQESQRDCVKVYNNDNEFLGLGEVNKDFLKHKQLV